MRDVVTNLGSSLFYFKVKMVAVTQLGVRVVLER